MPAYVKPLRRFILLTTLCLFAALPSVGADSCFNLFEEATPAVTSSAPELTYGKLKPNFQHDTNYKVELSNEAEIKDQCTLGTCHLHSWVAQLERNSAKKNENVKISTHYLSAMHWLNRSLETLESKDDKIQTALGATPYESRRALIHFGLVPPEAWHGGVDFQKDPLAKKAEQYIKTITARTKWSIERELDPVKKQALLELGKKQIKDVFTNMVGPMPTEFSFRGERYTPKTFAKRFFPEITRSIVRMAVNIKRKDKNQVEVTPSGFSIKTNLEQIEKTARELLDKGISVYLTYQHNSEYVDRKTGVMSIAGFSFPSEARPLTREQRDYYELYGGHAVQIIGYDVDPNTNKVSKWKIQNSYGENVGDHGIYHMYRDYFRSFVTSIVFFREPDIRLPVNESTEPKGQQLKFPF